MRNPEKLYNLFDILDLAAKSYKKTIAGLAFEIGMSESNLRDELTQQGDAKLGLLHAILIMEKTKDLRALDRIEAFFDRVAFELPRAERKNMQPVMHLISKMSKAFGENISQMADAMKDGVVTTNEAKKCLKENRDLIQVCVELQAYLEQFINQKKEVI